MTLCISLRSGEKMIVNGAVMRANGRADLVIENRVAVLRGREVMAPAEATTPARRLYLAAMMAYVDEAGRTAHQDRIVELLGELIGAIEDHEARANCMEFARYAALGDYYRALGVCRALIEYEDIALARTAGQAA
ncbi:flagellar biosynthesis repressor FlbT [Sphingomonas sp.]|jgi:flagellar protein FlbT|uniref:flagellar biosynthesis repressor FlbT n=1 Tax=Sphingomonas sp. TaxID=28214 RepID=UPI002ED87E18